MDMAFTLYFLLGKGVLVFFVHLVNCVLLLTIGCRCLFPNFFPNSKKICKNSLLYSRQTKKDKFSIFVVLFLIVFFFIFKF